MSLSGWGRHLALLFLLMLGAAGAADPQEEIPKLDLAGMETDVSAALSESLAELHQQLDSAEAWGAFAALCHAHGLHDAAQRAYRQALRRAPREYRWAYLLAVVRELEAADAGEVTELFDAAARLRPDDALLQLRKGLALSRRGRFAEARVSLERAVALAPESAAAQRALGQSLLALGDPSGALRRLSIAARLAPQDRGVFQALARAHLQLGEEELAGEAASKAARLRAVGGFPDPLLEAEVDARGVSARHRYARAQRLLDDGQLAAAGSELERLATMRPDDPDVLYLQGLAAARAGKIEDAMAKLEATITLHPGHVRARSGLARLLSTLGRQPEALQQYLQALETTPNDPSLLAAAGFLQATAGDLDGAIRSFEQLRSVVPDEPQVRINLGTAYYRAGRPELALQCFSEAVRLDPDLAEAHERRGIVLSALGREAEAKQELQQALRLNPDSPIASRMAGSPSINVREEFEEIAERLYSGTNRYLGRAAAEQIEQRLTDPGLSGEELLRSRIALARRRIEAGAVDAAIALIEKASAAASSVADPELVRELQFTRGLVYMRQAELQNCVLRHNRDCCLFPLTGGGIHEVRTPARRARESFEALLAMRPDDLRVRWLLNVMAMALGDYPSGIPERFRLPPSSFVSDYALPRFTDIAPQLGVDRFNLCGGAVVEDFDGDGFLDIVTSSYDPNEPLTFYRNDRRGGFVDRTVAARLDSQFGGLNCLSADYDGDGDADLLVLRGAWLHDDGKIRNSLLRNDGDGTFSDVTRAAGLAFPAYPTQAAAWGDFDNDGDLDLYVGNESRKYRPDDPADFPSQLFRNNGSGSFTDVAAEAGVTNDHYAKGVAAGDYDNDGDLDLYVSNVFANRLYRNDGGLRFTDVAEQAGVTEPSGRSFASWFFDYDNDGWLDLFVTAYDAGVADLAAQSLGRSDDAQRPRLYRNNGDGTFSDRTRSAGLDHVYLPMGASFGDLDNDGFLDIYLATGGPDFESLMPNVMLRNDGGVRFQDVTTAGGFGHLQKGHGVAFADIDNDGDQDIYHQLGGFFPGDKFHNVLFENPGSESHSITLQLVGSQSHRSGHGARVHIVVPSEDGVRSIHRAVGSVSSFGGTPMRLEVGIGRSTRLSRIEIRWPRSEGLQRFDDVEIGALLRITEGSQEIERLPLMPIKLGSSKPPASTR